MYDFKFKAEFTVAFPCEAYAKHISSASCETLFSAHISARWHLSSKMIATKWPFLDLRKDNENHEGSQRITYLDDNESCKTKIKETKIKT